MNYKCYASCAFGIEGILAEEIRDLGLKNVQTKDARVYFEGDEKDIARANIYLRTADRVYIILSQFTAKTFDEIFCGVNKIEFGDFLPSDARFPVTGDAVCATIMSVSDIQSVCKKAVVKALSRKYGVDVFKENGSIYNIYINNLRDNITVALNTSGFGLNRRGYRLKNVQAPLKETLAAGMIKISRWHSRDFYDVMCGSGTIAIEAAMMACNMAPGIKRRFDAQGFNKEFKEAFSEIRQEAQEKITKPKMRIVARDIDRKSLELAKEHAQNMGVREYIEFAQMDLANFTQPENQATIIVNPPYAVRMGEEKEVAKLYKKMGEVFGGLQNTVTFIICSDETFEIKYNIKADKKRKLYNGNLKCNYYQYFKKRS